MNTIKKLGRTGHIGLILSILIGLVFVRIIFVQISSSGKTLVEISNIYGSEHVTIQSDRGLITDRYGNLLAGNKVVYELGINLGETNRNPHTIAKHLSSILGKSYDEIYQVASKPYKKAQQEYVPLEDFVDNDTINQIRDVQKNLQENPEKAVEGGVQGTLAGVTWTPHLKREYPEGSLAANIIGYFGFRDRVSGGPHYGIEEEYNVSLAGTKLEMDIPIDPRAVVDVPVLPPGDTIVLTIDRRMQAAVENILDRAVEKNKAETGVIIVMDPKTGEILAMASNPRLDPNKYWDQQKVLDTKSYNRPIDITYEPGSVFKVLTMAAAFDAGVVNADTTFNDTGSIELGGYTIYNWDRNAWGQQTMLGCMQHSLNVCLTWVALQLGPDRFYDYMKAFGIGQYTNIDMYEEKIFPLAVPGDANWYPINLGTNSFGQGLAVNPTQMIQAIGALANDGKMMAPHIVKATIRNGQKIDTAPRVVGTPVSAKTAHDVSNMLAVSLEEEASSAYVEGYRMAGKTGTGEIPDAEGYTSQVTNTSFVGWGPVDDPKMIVYVWLEKPRSSIWGSIVASPIFAKTVEEVAAIMDLPTDDVRQQLMTNAGR